MIESIERFIPGDRASAAEDLRRIADGLEPVPAELRDLGAQLQTTAAQLAAADPTLVELEDDRGPTSATTSPRCRQPSTNWSSPPPSLATTRRGRANDRVDLDLWLARLVIVLVGAVMAIALRPHRPPGQPTLADPGVRGGRAPQQTLGQHETLG